MVAAYAGSGPSIASAVRWASATPRELERLRERAVGGLGAVDRDEDPPERHLQGLRGGRPFAPALGVGLWLEEALRDCRRHDR